MGLKEVRDTGDVFGLRFSVLNFMACMIEPRGKWMEGRKAGGHGHQAPRRSPGGPGPTGNSGSPGRVSRVPHPAGTRRCCAGNLPHGAAPLGPAVTVSSVTAPLQPPVRKVMGFQAPRPQAQRLGSLYPRILNGKGGGNLALNTTYKLKALGKIVRK